jgi:pyridoxine 5-phosphate synthase
MKLGVNIDHVATLREARRGLEPSPVIAALICESAGADSIVAHLREDRRHIKEADVFLLRKTVRSKFNLEMSCASEIVDIACRLKPDQVTLVPEKRQELTTEGGLDIAATPQKIKKAVEKLRKHGIEVSIFIDPNKRQIDAAHKIGVNLIEIHTGSYADARTPLEGKKRLETIKRFADYAKEKGFSVFAGHGLNYYNVKKISRIQAIEELNIGHSIISRAVLFGLTQAVKDMKAAIK